MCSDLLSLCTVVYSGPDIPAIQRERKLAYTQSSRHSKKYNWQARKSKIAENFVEQVE